MRLEFDFRSNLIKSKPPFLLTRLVTIAALLRRYSPLPHPHLTLCSGYSVTFLLSLTIQLCRANSERLYLGGRLYLEGPSWFLGNPNRYRLSLKYIFNLKADSSRNIAPPWLFLRRICLCIPLNIYSLIPSYPIPYLYIANFYFNKLIFSLFNYSCYLLISYRSY
jgi:hypothetical protein